MDYKEAVERKITGEGDEVNQRRKLWDKIVKSHKRGGMSAIESVLTEEYSNKITEEFDKLLKQLEEKR